TYTISHILSRSVRSTQGRVVASLSTVPHILTSSVHSASEILSCSLHSIPSIGCCVSYCLSSSVESIR
ncbi:hypothetical protein PENTCL1PPCAC_7789, partial [Pristionchus entomophagus]